jgi:hypothetical protein
MPRHAGGLHNGGPNGRATAVEERSSCRRGRTQPCDSPAVCVLACMHRAWRVHARRMQQGSSSRATPCSTAVPSVLVLVLVLVLCLNGC